MTKKEAETHNLFVPLDQPLPLGVDETRRLGRTYGAVVRESISAEKLGDGDWERKIRATWGTILTGFTEEDIRQLGVSSEVTATVFGKGLEYDSVIEDNVVSYTYAGNIAVASC